MTEPEGKQDLLAKLAADGDLRDRFVQDPVGVTEEHGLTLSEGQKTTLTAENWIDKTEEELLAILQDVNAFFWF